MVGLAEGHEPADGHGPPAHGHGLIRALAGLKLTILRHSPTGLRQAGRLLGVAAVAAAWAVALLAGSDRTRYELLMLAALAATAGWLVGPSLASGTGVLRPEFFVLLPTGRRRLGLGLLATGFVGFGPAVTLAVLAAFGVHAVALGPATLAVTVPGVLLLLAFMVTVSRLFFAVLGAAMHSRFGVEISGIQYGALVAAMFVGWAVLDSVVDATPELVRAGLPDGALTDVLAALPSSWPLRAIETAAAGHWPAALGWLAALAALTAGLALAAVLTLAPRRTRNRSRRRRRRRPGSGRSLRETPLGLLGGRWWWAQGALAAVAGKELRLWWRDPWRKLELRTMWWAGVISGGVALLAGIPHAAPFAGLIVAFGAVLVACNLYGQDGTALWQLVVGAGPGTVRADVRGRQLAVMLVLTAPAVLLSAGFTLLSGQAWAWPVVLAMLPAMIGAGSGLGLLLSVVAATPGVDPQHRVGPNDAGDVTFQVWVALIALPVLVSPVAVVAGAAAGTGSAGLAVLAAAAGLLDGGLLAWWLGRVAHLRLAARLPETFGRLRYGKAVPVHPPASGGGWLDRAERSAIESNKQHTPVGS